MDVNNIFGSKTTKSEELSKKSGEAISTFHKVVSDLSVINEQSEIKKKELRDAALEIEKEINGLEAMEASNLKVINNIQNILN